MKTSSLAVRLLQFGCIVTVSSMVLLCVVLVTVGLHLRHFSLGSVAGRGLSLNWNQGLVLRAAELRVRSRSAESGWDGASLRNGLKMVEMVRPLIASVAIDALWINGYRLQVDGLGERGDRPLRMSLDSDDIRFRAAVIKEDNRYRIRLEDVSGPALGFRVAGSFLFDMETLRLQGRVRGKVADLLPVTLDLQLDTEKVRFKGSGTEPVATIEPIVDLFGLDRDIVPWICEYLTGSSYSLTGFSGEFFWNNPDAFLDSLQASVRVKDCAYTFARGFEPVRSSFTDFNFSGGVLDITPHDTRFYGQSGAGSRLNINFNDSDNILLTLFLKTRAALSKDIHRLLAWYEIDLPFVQTRGKVGVDLTLAVNLNTEAVRANGRFAIENSGFRFDQAELQVDKGSVILAGEDVTLSGLLIRYDKTIAARVGGLLSPSAGRADIDITLSQCSLPFLQKELRLDTTEAPLRINYHLWAGRGTLTSTSSRWQLGKRTLLLDGFTTPFDYSHPSLSLSSTRLQVPPEADLVLNGKVEPSDNRLALQVKLKRFKNPFLTLDQDMAEITVRYDEDLLVKVEQKTNWLVGGQRVVLSPLTISRRNRTIHLGDTGLYSSMLQARVRGVYNPEKGQAGMSVQHLRVAGGNQLLLQVPEEMTLDLVHTDGALRVNLEKLGLALQRGKKGSLDINILDFGRLRKYSPLLTWLDIRGGNAYLSARGTGQPLRFQGMIRSSYDFFVENEQPRSEYRFSGIWNGSDGELQVNRNLHVFWGEKINIQADSIGFNLPAFLRLRENTLRQNDEQPASTFPEVLLEGRNCFLRLNSISRVPADRLQLTVKGEQRIARLDHGAGRLDLQAEGEQFGLKGDNFDGKFMDALFGTGRFEGGSLSVLAEGTPDRFNAVLQTGPMLLKKHVLLNNILAVINTVPALVTFSLPGYKTNGWPINSALLACDCVQGKATITTLEVESDQLDVRGSGTVDFINQQVDLKLNLITRAGQNVAHIPMVGYILAGEEKRPSITFHITGNMLDPQVTNTAFEEVMTMPFGMIYRTIKTPFNWANRLFGLDKTDRDAGKK